MLEKTARSGTRLLLLSHEILFSLNIAFFAVLILFLSNHDFEIPIIHMEVSLTGSREGLNANGLASFTPAVRTITKADQAIALFVSY
jgi:hypothetical protein